MAAITIGKYKRPGIFFEEIDQSIIPPPPGPAPLASTLVVGFSKKGPINAPILISSVDDLEKIYGPLDRTLERKGSYFHRTIAKILETSPVLAMNLLPTSDTLDLIEYQSLATSTSKMNSDIAKIPFRAIHDTSSFWKRDNETFIDSVKTETDGADRLFHITNISNRPVTVFIFKTQLTGFDQSLIEYYGTAEKVPTFASALDFASDYMVDVLAVGGDWTNYKELAVDLRWSAYFDETGLKKSTVVDFASNRNVNTLAFNQGCSLIPFFRDSDGRNVFIETVINNNTDRSGLFCAFNADKLETGMRGDLVDILGNNLLKTGAVTDNDQEEIKFLSYNAIIQEPKRYPITTLDRADGVQQVFAFGPSISAFSPTAGVANIVSRNTALENWGALNLVTYSYTNLSDWASRTTYFADDLVRGLRLDTLNSLTAIGAARAGSASVVLSFDLASQLTGTISLGPWTQSKAYGVVNGETRYLYFGNGPTLSNFGFSMSIRRSSYQAQSATQTFYSPVYVDSTGEIKMSLGSTNQVAPILNDDDLVLCFAKYDVANNLSTPLAGIFTNSSILPVSISNQTNVAAEGFTATSHDLGGGDYTVTANGDTITLTFLNTANYSSNGGGNSNAFTQNDNPYRAWRKIRTFNNLVSLFNSDAKQKMVMISNLQNMTKVSCANFQIENIVDDTASNRSFDLVLGFTPTSEITNGNLIFYKVDDEYYPGNLGFDEKSTRGATSFGVIGKYNQFYLDFKNGQINNGDFFYENLVPLTYSIPGVSMRYPVRTVFTETLDGKPAIVFNSLTFSSGKNYAYPWGALTPIGGTESIIVGNSQKNFKTFTIIGTTSNVNDPLTGTYFASSPERALAYLLDKPVEFEDINSATEIFNVFNRTYLRAWTDTNGIFNVRYSDDTLTGIKSGFVANTSTAPVVISELSNYKQTIEIYEPAGVIVPDNKILVDANSYGTITVGQFLQAKVDPTMLQTGEVGRRLTRILGKKPWSVDENYTEISCDSAIDKFGIEGVLQTIAFTSVDSYATTLKGLKLTGFKIREEIVPDGSETRQVAILDMVKSGTPLFKALVNKDAIDFRYVVDSFGNGLIADSKQQLVDIVGERLDCFGFINMPSIRQFKNSANPSFTNDDGTINTSYIAKGGNVDKGPRFLYSFGKGKGVSAVGYFLPYLLVNDGGRPTELPPAMYAANTYLRKITGANPSLLPWTIAAGVTNGRILNIDGVETSFSFEDIENLNLAQMNPIVFKRNRGFAIETENTAQVIYKSSLSYIHVREVLIELERELGTMLLDYQWKFNTPETRAEIKLKADGICEKYVNKNGLYNYFNKCDEENNTPDLIDRQIGVIDTYVEPIKGMGVIVNNITILRTGAIEAGGFA